MRWNKSPCLAHTHLHTYGNPALQWFVGKGRGNPHSDFSWKGSGICVCGGEGGAERGEPGAVWIEGKE